jgi:hypothetical protein
MKIFSFKYYPARILLTLFCIALTLVILVKGFFMPEANFINIALWVVGSASLLAIFFKTLNKYCLKNCILKMLDLPKLKGSYTGELISSYHIDDDETKPHIKKYVKMKIYQNLNGFLVEAKFYNSKNDDTFTSETESINHDIVSKGNGDYTITYLYRNKGNKLTKENKKYSLNNHEGVAILEYSTATKALNGSYFNDAAERQSFGRLNLKKNKL